MPLPKDGEVQLFQVVDTDGNPARVSLIAGVYRLAVDALLVGPAGAYAQGDFDSVAVDEANALAMWVRSAVTALDSSQAAGSRNVPVASRAAVAAQAYTLQRLLTDGVIRADDGATYAAVAARAAVAAQAYALNRLLVDSASRFDSGADWAAGLVRQSALTINETLNHILVRAALTANDSSAGGGAQNIAIQGRGAVAAQAYALQRLLTDTVVRGDDGATYSAVAARNFDADGDIVETLVGLLVNARLGVLRRSSGAWARLGGDFPDNVSGASTGASLGVYANAICVGHDNTGAAVLRPVEARNYDDVSDVATSLIGLLVNSRGSLKDINTGAWGFFGGLDINGAGGVSGYKLALTADYNESGFSSSILGRRFIATSQTAGATLTAQAAFVATTPTLMLRQSAGATETEVVRSISISSFAATPLGIRVVVMLDPDDRLSAGGTSVTPQNPNEGSAAASGITSFLENPTATAADADERIIYNEGFAGGLGAKLVIEFKDEAILSGAGTLLVYVFDSAGATAPTIAYGVEWEEYV